ncbi:hypothetical protein ACJX0J_015902, partial [Zea mays]
LAPYFREFTNESPQLLNYIPHRKVLMIYPYCGLNTQLYSISTSTAEGTKNLFTAKLLF